VEVDPAAIACAGQSETGGKHGGRTMVLADKKSDHKKINLLFIQVKKAFPPLRKYIKTLFTNK